MTGVFLVAIASVTLALFVYLVVVSAYVGQIAIGALLYRRRPAKPSRAFKCAIVIPAHNEGRGLRPTLRDLDALDYPSNLVDVHVIADNCCDDTASIAAHEGAIVHERHDLARRGKGQALDWFLKHHKAELARYDLIAFIDADMRVDPQFLNAVSANFASGTHSVVQARYTIAPDIRTWQGGIGFASFAYVNHVRQAGRCFWGGSSDLKGSGMVFRSELILETGWPMHSITEDLEFGKALLLGGNRIVYEPRAIVMGEIPATLAQVEVQQLRWESGRSAVARRFFVPILRRLLRRPSVALLDALMDLLVPSLSIALLLIAIDAAAAMTLQSLPLLLFLVPLAGFAIAVVTGMLQLRASPRIWFLLATAPAFVLWKLWLLAKVAVLPVETQWRRTPRDTE